MRYFLIILALVCLSGAQVHREDWKKLEIGGLPEISARPSVRLPHYALSSISQILEQRKELNEIIALLEERT